MFQQYQSLIIAGLLRYITLCFASGDQLAMTLLYVIMWLRSNHYSTQPPVIASESGTNERSNPMMLRELPIERQLARGYREITSTRLMLWSPRSRLSKDYLNASHVMVALLAVIEGLLQLVSCYGHLAHGPHRIASLRPAPLRCAGLARNDSV